jgi:nicotinic acid mononucleotide adenylyltransferase/isopentenyldiphosphate isomerase
MLHTQRKKIEHLTRGGIMSGERVEMRDGEAIPVVDHAIGHFISYKSREVVHTEGDFHLGVQAYIVRKDEAGQLVVLVQTRSHTVDISKGRNDQSLATQLLAKDKGDLSTALKRGLMEELSISEDEIEFASIGAPAEFRIHKKYEEDPLMYNREFIYLYFVKVNRADIRSNNPKVAGLEWMEWSAFVQKLKNSPADFAKTARFYVMNPKILEETERVLQNFIDGHDLSDVNSNFPVKKGYYYGYPGRYDAFISMYRNNTQEMHVYDYVNKEFNLIDEIKSFDAYEGKDRESVAIRITKKNGKNLIWENGVLTETHLVADPRSVQTIKTIISKLNAELKVLEGEVHTMADKKMYFALLLKLNHLTNIIFSRVLAGEMQFCDRLPQDETEGFKISVNVPNLTILSIPGTFDPPHFAHLELLLDALVHESEKARGRRTAYALFFTPVGQNSPGPQGQPWKSAKTESTIRHEMCLKACELFVPMIQTSLISLRYPNRYGTENAVKILDSLKKSPAFENVLFVVAIGTDTYRNWGENISRILQKSRYLYTGTHFKILIRESWQDPLEEALRNKLAQDAELLRGVYSLPVRSTHIRLGQFNMIPSSVRRYIDQHGHYQEPIFVQMSSSENK